LYRKEVREEANSVTNLMAVWNSIALFSIVAINLNCISNPHLLLRPPNDIASVSNAMVCETWSFSSGEHHLLIRLKFKRLDHTF